MSWSRETCGLHPCVQPPVSPGSRCHPGQGLQQLWGHRGDTAAGTEHPPRDAPVCSAAPVCTSSQPGGSWMLEQGLTGWGCAWSSQKWAATSRERQSLILVQACAKSLAGKRQSRGGLTALPVQDRQHLAVRDGLHQLWHRRKWSGRRIKIGSENSMLILQDKHFRLMLSSTSLNYAFFKVNFFFPPNEITSRLLLWPHFYRKPSYSHLLISTKDVIKDMKQHTLVMEHWIKPAVIYMTGNFKIQVF